MTDQEYQNQHELWQIDHDKVMHDMRMEQELTKEYPYRKEAEMDEQWSVLWKWCSAHYHCDSYCWDRGYFYFKREEDYVFFLLKWSGHE